MRFSFRFSVIVFRACVDFDCELVIWLAGEGRDSVRPETFGWVTPERIYMCFFYESLSSLLVWAHSKSNLFCVRIFQHPGDKNLGYKYICGPSCGYESLRAVLLFLFSSTCFFKDSRFMWRYRFISGSPLC